MIYITLPDFYLNYNIVNNINTIDKKYFKYPLTFSAVSGNFPYCSWDGGYNINYIQSFALYEELIDKINYCQIPIRFNCSNCFLQTEDYDDTYTNLILKFGETGSNTISVSNLSLWEKLKEKYPFYSFIFSREANLIYNMTTEIINELCESGNFELIEIPSNFVDFNNIKHKNKVELLINSNCPLACRNYQLCKIEQHKAHYNFSKKNCNIECIQSKNQILISNEKLEELIQQGFSHFSIDSFHIQEEFINFFIDYFIKEEYKFLVYKELIK